jgi:alkylation response protein AidB-like acyl-CoA dehydrogenase
MKECKMSAQRRYLPPLADIAFVIEHWLNAPADWRRMPDFRELDADTARMICESAGAFCAERLAPLNGPGDLQGCQLKDGRVTTPEGFAVAYRAYVEAGWPSLACAPSVGGQGLPGLLDACLNEMVASSNHAWAMYIGILHGAYACLRAHASESLKALYLPRLVSGEWLATMCLTEPQAGSDLSLLRARAQPAEDGSFRIDGSKIFISGGAQDWTDNIVHLVLARLPDAPTGTKGLSLFLVPQHIPLPTGQFAPNTVYCDGIEKKMGIKGSATCAMRFEQATGWLIGRPHGGLSAMFVMMNSARLHVGLQGLGHAEAAYQLATAYAEERVQMKAAVRPADATGPADAIVNHAPVRRVLWNLRVWTQGMRALGYWCGHQIDLGAQAQNPEERLRAQMLTALLTPVVKALFTERGFELASDALQVLGGYGYIHEYGIEQTVRDSRIAMIYEGTNQLQALDLLQRKVLGSELGLLPLLEAMRAEAALPSRYSELLNLQCDRLEAATLKLRRQASQDAELPSRVAEDYLRWVGYVAMAFVWCRAARVADDAHAHKREGAAYFYDHVLPDAAHWQRRVEAAEIPLPAL